MASYATEILNIEARLQTLTEKFGVSLLKESTFNKFISKVEDREEKERFLTLFSTVKAALDNTFPNEYDIKPRLHPVVKFIPFTYGLNSLSDTNWYEYVDYKIEGFDVIVHFPEVEITNSLGQKHTIKNLFVKFLFESTGMKEDCFGARTELSSSEHSVGGYRHSHLTRERLDKDMEWGSFCRGSDHFAMSILGIVGRHPLQEEIELMLESLKLFVRWESLEGGPYITMDKIIEQSKDVPTLSSREISHYVSIVRAGAEVIKLSRDFTPEEKTIHWKINKGKLQIIEDETFEKFLVKAASTNLGIVIDSKLFLTRDHNKNYFQRKSVNEQLLGSKHLLLVFRGQKFHATITKGEEIKVDSSQLYLHPKIKKYVKQWLEHNANYQAFIESQQS